MTYFNFRWLFFLILFAVCGYYLLLFFSKLTGINIFSAISWGFRSGVSIGKGFPVWLLPFMAILFYPFLFTAVFLFLETPLQIYQMKNHHEGGLLGYRDGLKAQVYDPSGNIYITYDHLNPPPAASKFTEAFDVVLLYKYKPSSKYYKDTGILGLSTQLPILLMGAVGLLMVYICLYALVEAYIGENDLQIKLSHYLMASQFKEITGMPLVKALLIALFVYVFVLGAGIVSVRILKKHYRDLYSYYQQELKSNLLSKVSPMETIKGTVIRRHYVEKNKFYSDRSIDNTGNRVGQGGKTIHYTVPVFTIEFRDLIQIPVYLNLTTRPSESAREDEDSLSMLFPDQWKVIPKEMQEFDFTVNPDYSITLKKKINY